MTVRTSLNLPRAAPPARVASVAPMRAPRFPKLALKLAGEENEPTPTSLPGQTVKHAIAVTETPV